MRKKVSIVQIESNDKVSFYSPRYKGEELTEFEKFIKKYSVSHRKDIQTIITRLDNVKRTSNEDRHFRYESKKRDRVRALPSHLDSSILRLYCIVLAENILVLGNGGLKPKGVRTYNEDAILNKCVSELVKIDLVIKKMQRCKEIWINGCKLYGNLDIEIND